jgi:hypothetical protein
MNVVTPVIGALLVGAVLRDVFHTLFHPAGQGTITMQVFRAVWALTGRVGARARQLAGPLAMASVIASWAGLLVLGWALIYWAALPAGFIFASPLDARDQRGFIDALYFSWVTQTTLGFGDIAPRDEFLRVLAPLHATLGFGLFTVAVTWVLSVYPALQRQRALASAAHSIRRSHADRSPAQLPQAPLTRQLERLAQGVTLLRVDFLQYPSTFYFAAPGRSTSLVSTLPYLLALADADGLGEEARLVALELRAELDFLAHALATQFLSMPNAETDDVLRAFGRHHRLAGAAQQEVEDCGDAPTGDHSPP